MRGAMHRNAREMLKAANPKFHAGPNPLEREASLKVIQPTDKQSVEAMTKMLNKLYGKDTNSAEERQALDLWKFQVASGTVNDQVKFQFLRRFYFWLLGRGEEGDVAKTFWGKANVAVYNPEVAAYIDQFVGKRAQYAQQLALLANRLPDNLNGFYLYFKYIVNGALKRTEPGPDGNTFWDMTQEDYLEDFDMLQQVLDSSKPAGGNNTRYAELIAPQAKGIKDVPNQKHFEANVPYPTTRQALGYAANAPAVQLSSKAMEKEAVANLNTSLSIGKRGARNDKEEEVGDNGQLEIAPKPSNIAGANENPNLGVPGKVNTSDLSALAETPIMARANSRVSFAETPAKDKVEEEEDNQTPLVRPEESSSSIRFESMSQEQQVDQLIKDVDGSLGEAEESAGGKSSSLSFSDAEKAAEEASSESALRDESTDESRELMATRAKTLVELLKAKGRHVRQIGDVVIDLTAGKVYKFEDRKEMFTRQVAFLHNPHLEGLTPKLISFSAEKGVIRTRFLRNYETLRNTEFTADDAPAIKTALGQAFFKLDAYYSDIANPDNIMIKRNRSGVVKVKFVEGGKRSDEVLGVAEVKRARRTYTRADNTEKLLEEVIGRVPKLKKRK